MNEDFKCKEENCNRNCVTPINSCMTMKHEPPLIKQDSADEVWVQENLGIPSDNNNKSYENPKFIANSWTSSQYVSNTVCFNEEACTSDLFVYIKQEPLAFNQESYAITGSEKYPLVTLETNTTVKSDSIVVKIEEVGDLVEWNSPDRQFKCDICQQLLPATCKESHRYIHSLDTIFTCLVCYGTFNLKQDLRKHIVINHFKLTVTNAGPHLATVCMRKADNTGVTKYQCDICRLSCNSKLDLVAHKYTHTAISTYTCCICYKNYRLKSSLYSHMVTVHYKNFGKKFDCLICHKRFKAKAYLVVHKRIHIGEKRYECIICYKRFTRSADLTRHNYKHTGEKPHKCDICNKGCTTTSELKNHKYSHTDMEHYKSVYKCDICLKLFTSTSALLKHSGIHTGEKPFKCDFCDKRFRLSGILINHMRTHTGEKPYKCDICLAVFSTSTGIVNHSRIHTGEKPFKCDFCEKRFSVSGSLTSHKRIHTGEKPYKCDICQQRFSVKRSLDRHKKMHAFENPLNCVGSNDSVVKLQN